MKYRPNFWFLTALVLVVLLAPNLIKPNIILGEESYYHARISKQIAEEGIPTTDKFMDRPYIFDLYNLILAGFIYIFGVVFASKILPVLLGIITFLLAFFILKEIKVNKRRPLIMLMVSLSPVFIYNFSISNKYSLSVTLILAGIFLLLKKSKTCNILSAISFALVGFTNMLGILISIFVLFWYYKRKFVKGYILITLIAASCINYLPVLYKQGISEIPSFISTNILPNFISDLGANIGFGIFTVILAVIGLITSWKFKRRYYPIYGLLIFILLLSVYFGDKVNFYLNFILCYFGGYGFWVLADKKWQVKLIKDLTLIILICGVIFSAVSFMARESKFEPNEDIIKSLNWLKKNSKEDDVILSHYSNGLWIEAVAERRVVMDSMFQYTNAEERYNDSENMFKSVYVDDSLNLLKKYNVKYIWIDKKMREGEVWSKEKEGMLILFRNNETFKNVYKYNGIEIWELVRTQ